MKMYECFTARYSDGRTAFEKSLEWIYEHLNCASVEIQSTILLRKANENIFIVDYCGAGLGCTLGAFDKLKDAENFKKFVMEMDRSEFKNWMLNKRSA